MNLIKNIKNFLLDQKYFVSFFDNYVHMYKYQKIVKFSEKQIIVLFDSFTLTINGINLIAHKMVDFELLVSGDIISIERINNE